MSYTHICCLFAVIAVGESLEVTIPNLGALAGSEAATPWTGQTIYQFLGVRYAEPPSGEMRFKNPVMIGPWYGTLDAANLGQTCPSINILPELMAAGYDFVGDPEDCLNLQIYTKNITASQAVIVYIAVNNSIITRPYNLLENDVVLVIPQFRLELFGFLSTQSDDIPGNAGLMDIIVALQWIEQYIQYFGGDANRITLMGYSAGGHLISALMSSTSVPNDLFHRVIIQSPYYVSAVVDEEPMERVMELINFTNCTVSDDTTVTDINQCFLNMTASDLIQTYNSFWMNSSYLKLHEVYGIVVAESERYPVIQSDNVMVRNVPLMAGVTKYDSILQLWYVLTGNGISTSDANDSNLVFNDIINMVTKSLAGDENYELISSLLTGMIFTQSEIIESTFTSLVAGLIDVTNTIIVKSPTLKLLQSQLENYSNQTYLYTFDYEGEFSTVDLMSDQLPMELRKRIAHGDELIYLLRYFEDYWPNAVQNENDLKMAAIMVDFWTSFAMNGVPMSSDTPEWLPVTQSSGPYMHLNSNCTIGDDFYMEFAINKNEQMMMMMMMTGAAMDEVEENGSMAMFPQNFIWFISIVATILSTS